MKCWFAIVELERFPLCRRAQFHTIFCSVSITIILMSEHQRQIINAKTLLVGYDNDCTSDGICAKCSTYSKIDDFVYVSGSHAHHVRLLGSGNEGMVSL